MLTFEEGLKESAAKREERIKNGWGRWQLRDGYLRLYNGVNELYGIDHND